MGSSSSTRQLLRELKRKARKSFLKVSAGELVVIMRLIVMGECLYLPVFQALGKLKGTCEDSLPKWYFFRVPFRSLPLVSIFLTSCLGRSRHVLGRMSVTWRQRQSHQGCRQAHNLSSVGRCGEMVATFTSLSRLFVEQPLLRRGRGGVQMALESAARGNSWQHSMLHAFSIS